MTERLKIAQEKLNGTILANPYVLFTAAVVALGVAMGKVADRVYNAEKYAKKALDESADNVDEVRSEIDSLNSELKTTQDRIDELNAKENLTLVEQDELNRLKETNDELERELRLKQSILSKEEKEANKDAKKYFTTKKDSLNFETSYEGVEIHEETDYIGTVEERIDRLQQYAEGKIQLSEETIASYKDYVESAISDFMDEDDYLLEGLDDGILNRLDALYEKYDIYTNGRGSVIEEKISGILAKVDFQDEAKQLEELGKNGSLSVDTLASRFPDLINYLNEAGISAEELYQYIMALSNPDAINYQEVEKQLLEQLGIRDGDVRGASDQKIYDEAKSLGLLENESLEAYLTVRTKFTDGQTTEWSPKDWADYIQKEINGELDADETSVFKSFNDTEIGQRLQHATNLFNEGKISYKEYFNGLQTEIENVDFSHYTDSLEDAQNAAGQLFVDTTQQTAQGLTNLINSFNSNEMSVTEYIDSYLSIAETLGTLTDELQENSEAWDKNGKALSESENMNLDGVQSDLNSAIETIKSYQDSIYGLEQILSGKLELGTDEFTAQTNVIAEDLANIVSSGGEMSEEIKNYMGDSADEIAQSLTEDVSNFDIASQAIAANTNVAIQNMATSIGELFEELGKAISNFKVDLSFGVSSITMQDVDMGILGTHQLPAVTFSLEASGDSLSSIGSAISSFGKNFSENLGQYIEYPDFTIEPEGDEYVPGDDVLSNYNNQLEKLKNASGKAGKDAGEAYKDAVEKELNNLDSVISAVGGLIDDQIDHIQDQCDAAIDALERERDAIIDGLEDEKKALEDAVEAKQDQIDAIKEAREERSAELDLQKKEYELERLQNQRTRLVYSDSKGFHYEQDTSEIRDAKEAVDQAKEEIEILKIEKEISVLEDSIDNISDKIEEVNNHYDDLIAQTEQYYQSLIDGLENYKSRWEELGELKEQAEFKRQLEELGLSSVDILNMSEEAFHAFKTQYVDALDRYLQATGDGLDAVADIDLTSTADSVSKVADATTKIDDTKVANLSSAVEGLGDTSNLDLLYDAFEQLKTVIVDNSDTLNDVDKEGGLVSTLDALTKVSLGATGEEATGLIGQFVALKEAVDAVTTAIGGGAQGQNLPQGGAPTMQGAMTPSGGSDSGGTGGLTQVIKDQVEEATTLLPDEIAKFAGEEDSLEGAVQKVITKVAGASGEEGGQENGKQAENGEADPTHLKGAIQSQYDTAIEVLPDEKSKFEELLEVIKSCVVELNNMVTAMQNMSEMEFNFGNGSTGGGYKGTVGNAFAKGTMNIRSLPITGYKGLPHDEKNAMRSEYGQPELTVYPDGTTELTSKPVMSDLPKGTVIFNEEQTRRIMNGNGETLGKAFANGTDISTIKTPTNLPSYLRPLQEGDKMFDLIQKMNTHNELIQNQIIPPVNSIQKNMDMVARNINHVNNRNTSMQDINININGGINLQGVQDPDALAKAINQRLPNSLKQELFKRK